MVEKIGFNPGGRRFRWVVELLFPSVANMLWSVQAWRPGRSACRIS